MFVQDFNSKFCLLRKRGLGLLQYRISFHNHLKNSYKIFKSITPIQISKHLEILHIAWQWYCRALCKISKWSSDYWEINNGQRNFIRFELVVNFGGMSYIATARSVVPTGQETCKGTTHESGVALCCLCSTSANLQGRNIVGLPCDLRRRDKHKQMAGTLGGIEKYIPQIDGLEHYWGIVIASMLKIMQYCTKPSI